MLVGFGAVRGLEELGIRLKGWGFGGPWKNLKVQA